MELVEVIKKCKLIIKNELKFFIRKMEEFQVESCGALIGKPVLTSFTFVKLFFFLSEIRYLKCQLDILNLKKLNQKQ